MLICWCVCVDVVMHVGVIVGVDGVGVLGVCAGRDVGVVDVYDVDVGACVGMMGMCMCWCYGWCGRTGVCGWYAHVEGAYDDVVDVGECVYVAVCVCCYACCCYCCDCGCWWCCRHMHWYWGCW